MGYIIILFLLTSFSIFSGTNEERYSIKEFEMSKFLGTWYEIAKNEGLFVSNLDFMKTTYTIHDGGEIDIVSKGFKPGTNREVTIKGKGKIKYRDKNKIENIIQAKFYSLAYSDFIIMDYDRENYNYAVIRGEKDDYFWILSRTPTLDNTIIKKAIRLGEREGINMDRLIMVKQK